MLIVYQSENYFPLRGRTSALRHCSECQSPKIHCSAQSVSQDIAQACVRPLTEQIHRMVHLLQASFQLSSRGRIRLVRAAALMLTFQTLSAATEVAWTSSSSWRGQVANGEVVSEKAKFIARSQSECAVLCLWFLFDTPTSTCHVMPQLGSSRESSQRTIVFSRTGKYKYN